MAVLMQIGQFYRDGFCSMTLGRTLWALILIKVVVLFGILKIWFFPGLLHTRFDNDGDRGAFVLTHLVEGETPARSQP